MREVWVQSLVGELRSHMPRKKPRHKPEAGWYKFNKDFKNKVHIENLKKICKGVHFCSHWSIDGVEVKWGYIWATGHLSNWVIHRCLRCKNLPAVQDTQEMQVQSLGREDALEEGMATHSSILAWRTPWTEWPSGLQSMGPKRVGHDWATNTFTLTHYVTSTGWKCISQAPNLTS